MKVLIGIFVLLFAGSLFAQEKEAPEIADSFERAIAEFKKPFEEQNFEQSIKLLEALRKEDPNNNEVKYYLGYSYDRYNNKDARNVPTSNPEYFLKASETFESIIASEPKYTGRKLVLDPYSKLTAIWGTLAFKYLHQGKLDSMNYALQQGKNRGGFNEFVLQTARNILKTCAENSILFVSGDNNTYPILYTQIIDSIRTDVQVIDISLINTNWYCELIQRLSSIDFLQNGIDFMQIPDYAISQKQRVDVRNSNCAERPNFNWEISKLRADKYLLKGDFILKEIVVRNEFKRNIYFTAGQFTDDLLSLDEHLTKGILVDRLMGCDSKEEEAKELNRQLKHSTFDPSTWNLNSQDIAWTIDLYRSKYLQKIQMELSNQNQASAHLLFAKMKENYPEEVTPIANPRLKEYMNQLSENLRDK